MACALLNDELRASSASKSAPRDMHDPAADRSECADVQDDDTKDRCAGGPTLQEGCVVTVVERFEKIRMAALLLLLLLDQLVDCWISWSIAFPARARPMLQSFSALSVATFGVVMMMMTVIMMMTMMTASCCLELLASPPCLETAGSVSH